MFSQGRVLRTGRALESDKQGSGCHHVQAGYPVSGGINCAQRAALPGACQPPGHGKFGFQRRGPQGHVTCDHVATGERGSHLLLREGEREGEENPVPPPSTL